MNLPARNAVMLALAQTGLLVAGILAVAASNRLARGLGYPDLRDFLFFLNHGCLLLPVPVIWITLAAELQLRPARRGTSHAMVSMSGIFLLATLVTAIAWETIEPWRGQKMLPMVRVEAEG